MYIYSPIDFYLCFLLTDEITFPTSTLIEQFLLQKNQIIKMDFSAKGYNEAFTILSKNSLRNIGITVSIYKGDDVTKFYR